MGKRPGLRFWKLSWEHLRPLLSFGLPATGNALLLALVFNADYLIVGRLLGARSLGYYTVAVRSSSWSSRPLRPASSGCRWPCACGSRAPTSCG